MLAARSEHEERGGLGAVLGGDRPAERVAGTDRLARSARARRPASSTAAGGHEAVKGIAAGQMALTRMPNGARLDGDGLR